MWISGRKSSVALAASFLLLTFFGASASEKNDLFGSNTEVFQNDWEIVCYTMTGESVINVTIKEKYGTMRSFTCAALFYNNSTREYKLVAPWIRGSIIIEKDNIVDLTFSKE